MLALTMVQTCDQLNNLVEEVILAEWPFPSNSVEHIVYKVCKSFSLSGVCQHSLSVNPEYWIPNNKTCILPTIESWLSFETRLQKVGCCLKLDYGKLAIT